LAAHSRQVNALACHPTKSIFVTVGDDTFLNVWEVESGAAFNIRLVMSSRVPDFMLTGVCFANQNYNSILATVYNFKTVIVWDDIV
jgi:WD40 repeat protein